MKVQNALCRVSQVIFLYISTCWSSDSSLCPRPTNHSINIGVVTPGSSLEFLAAWRPTLENYLSSSVGKHHDPQLNFSLIPVSPSSLSTLVKCGSVHFIFASSSIYSCLELVNEGLKFRVALRMNSRCILYLASHFTLIALRPMVWASN